MKALTIATFCAPVTLKASGQGFLDMDNANPVYDNTAYLLGPATGNEVTAEVLEGASPRSLAPVPSSICYVNQGFFYGPGLAGFVTIPGAPRDFPVDYAVEVWSTAAGGYASAQKTPGSY